MSKKLKKRLAEIESAILVKELKIEELKLRMAKREKCLLNVKQLILER